MKKPLSIVLILAMVLTTFLMLVSPVSATAASSAATFDENISGAVYYEEDFTDTNASLVDKYLAESIGWTAPSEHQTMVIEEDGEGNQYLRIVAQYTREVEENGATVTKHATVSPFKIIDDARISNNAIVIEYSFNYQSKQGDEDFTVTVDEATKTIKNDGQATKQTAYFMNGNGSDFWAAQILPTGNFDTTRCIKYKNSWVSKSNYTQLNNWNDRNNRGFVLEENETISGSNYTYEYTDSPTDTKTQNVSANSIMDTWHDVQLIIDPEAGVQVKVDGKQLNYMGNVGLWMEIAGSIMSSGAIYFRVQPGMDVCIDNIKMYEYIPEMAITEICINGTVSANEAYDWLEITNFSDRELNIYDYAVLQDNNPFAKLPKDASYGSTGFVATWTDGVNNRGKAWPDVVWGYMYPGEHTYTYTKTSKDNDDYEGVKTSATYTNPSYAEGVLQPGESAMILVPSNAMGYDANDSGVKDNVATLDGFKNYIKTTLGYTGDVKTFVCYSNYNLCLKIDDWKTYGISKVVNTGTDTAENYNPVPTAAGLNPRLYSALESYLFAVITTKNGAWVFGGDNDKYTTEGSGAHSLDGKNYYTKWTVTANQSTEISYWDENGEGSRYGEIAYQGTEKRGEDNKYTSVASIPESCQRAIQLNITQQDGKNKIYVGRYNVEYTVAAPVVAGFEWVGYDYSDTVSPAKTIPAPAMTKSMNVTAVYWAGLQLIGFQEDYNIDMGQEDYSIRFVSVLNSIEGCKELGYEVTLSYMENGKKVEKTRTISCTYVYTSIMVDGVNTVADDLEGNLAGYDYIFALHIDRIPVAKGEITMSVRTFMIDADNNTVYGDVGNATFNPATDAFAA